MGVSLAKNLPILSGASNYNWKGGKPKCKECGVVLSRRDYTYCALHRPTRVMSGSERLLLSKRMKGNTFASVNLNEMNPMWKGNSVSYRGLHQWIVRKLGTPDTCSLCSKSGLKGRAIHWASKNHSYSRNLDEWIRLCSKCHGSYDRRVRKGY